MGQQKKTTVNAWNECGARNPAQVDEQLGAVGVTFSQDELDLIDDILTSWPKPIYPWFHCSALEPKTGTLSAQNLCQRGALAQVRVQVPATLSQPPTWVCPKF